MGGIFAANLRSREDNYFCSTLKFENSAKKMTDGENEESDSKLVNSMAQLEDTEKPYVSEASEVGLVHLSPTQEESPEHHVDSRKPDLKQNTKK